MLVTSFKFNAGNEHVSYSIQVQCRIRTCKLHHSGPVPDTYMYVTASSLSTVDVQVSYSIQVQCQIRTCRLQHSGSVSDTDM
jgi:hypothetical protein